MPAAHAPFFAAGGGGESGPEAEEGGGNPWAFFQSRLRGHLRRRLLLLELWLVSRALTTAASSASHRHGNLLLPPTLEWSSRGEGQQGRYIGKAWVGGGNQGRKLQFRTQKRGRLEKSCGKERSWTGRTEEKRFIILINVNCTDATYIEWAIWKEERRKKRQTHLETQKSSAFFPKEESRFLGPEELGELS